MPSQNLWTGASHLIASSSPLLGGRMRDVRGDFRPGDWLCVSVSLVVLLLTPLLRPRRLMVRGGPAAQNRVLDQAAEFARVGAVRSFCIGKFDVIS
jgi:hypothetical protein